MEEQNVETRVRAIIKEVLKVNEERITNDARFKEDLGADSLDLVTLLMTLEQEFGGSISDKQALEMTTFGLAIATISQLKQNGKQGGGI